MRPNNGFRVLFNGVAVFANFDTNPGFIPFQTFTIQATGSLTTLEFQGRNAISGGVDYLDDVSVTPTQSGVRGRVTGPIIQRHGAFQTSRLAARATPRLRPLRSC